MFKEDSEIISTIIVASSVLLTIGIILLSLLLAYRNKNLRHQKQILEMHSKYQQEILQTQLEIQEQTLKNISQEIHDNIGQTLSLVKLNLNTIDLQKQNAEDKIVHSKELVSKAIQDLRNLSKSLNTDSVLSSGLVKAIETELAIIDHAGTFKTELQTKGQTARIDPKKELILFRIVQEAINNIIKHSEANTILVNLDFTNECLKIEVSDNGKGFNTDADNSEGLGLRNMKSRAELIGGSFEIASGSNGTILTVTLPNTES